MGKHFQNINLEGYENNYQHYSRLPGIRVFIGA